MTHLYRSRTTPNCNDLKKKVFKTSLGKGDNGGNQHLFLFFPTMAK